MLPFNIIKQPEVAGAVDKLGPARDLDLLVVYHGELALREFLGRVLAAAGYTEAGHQLHLLEWPAAEALDLTALVRVLGVSKVILFGYELPRLGLHFTVAQYFPLELNGVHYLVADSLEFISAAKEAGDNQPAAALWNAIKQDFLHQP